MSINGFPDTRSAKFPDSLLKESMQVAHRLPMNVTEADMIDFINEQSYITNEVHLRLFYNSWVSFDSVIYKNGFLIKETVPAKNYEGYYKF